MLKRAVTRFKGNKLKQHVLDKTTKEIKLKKLSRKLAAILSHCQTQWNVLQQEKLKKKKKKKKKRIEEKLKEFEIKRLH